MAKETVDMLAQKPKAEGVPRDTRDWNCLGTLKTTMTNVLGQKRAGQLVATVIEAGYFELALLDQGRLLVRQLTGLGQATAVVGALLASPSDRMRSLGVSVHFEHFKDDIERELESLKRTGALPGTWTQETSQSVLKNLVHHQGLKAILPRVAGWVHDPDPTVRRLVAEALRPRGVWCKHIAELKEDPTPIKGMLAALLDDESVYVQKAVANSLNDISKDNPELLCRWIAEWMKGTSGKERRWIIERALRTLVRESYPAAMKLLGLGDTRLLKVEWNAGTPREIRVGESVPFTLTVANAGRAPVKIRLQVVMIGPGKNKQLREAKYLLGNVTVSAKSRVEIRKAVKFDHRNSVPKIPGKYQWRVLCNGRTIGERESIYRGKDLARKS